MIDPLEIINIFYKDSDPAREILLLHSTQVRNKAVWISRRLGKSVDIETVSAGAMLHDIGIRFCNAPGIGCFGEADYLRHGITGAEKLRSLGIDGMEKFARICERHTGSGLTALEIVSGGLPLPERDFLPETVEEKIICLADKFFSKSGDMQEKSLESVRKSMAKFGEEPLKRFDDLCAELLQLRL